MLYIFNANDFVTRQNHRGEKILTLPRVSGFALVLFYSPLLTNCKPFDDIFKQLTRIVNGCQIGKVIIKHQDKDFYTGFIDAVPMAVFYFNGFPQISYNGGPELETLAMFIKDAAARVQEQLRREQQQTFMNNQQGIHAQVQSQLQQQPPRPPPGQTAQILDGIGIPLIGFDNIKNARYMRFRHDERNPNNNGYIQCDPKSGICYVTEDKLNIPKPI